VSGPGIYVHLPFCPYICPYCDFAKWRFDGDDARRYLAALATELAAAPQFAARTAYFGGGTPNAYAPADVARLVESVRTRFALPPGAEVTIETNPDVALCAGFAEYRAAGATRLSVGAQSFDAAVLRRLGRRHSAADVGEAVRRARAAGFANVSLDLMFGAPGQTVDSWQRTLDEALALGTEHVSTYGLTIEAGTPYEQWYAREPQAFADDDTAAEMYALAMDVLGEAGYEHYEISNFAKPGYRSEHNANYWANGEYLGLGVGAASYRAGTRRTNTRGLDEYVRAAAGGAEIPGDAERLGPAAAAGEAAMLALRTAQGVDVRAFAERYGIDFLERFQPVIAEMTSLGLLTADAGRVALTRRGRFLANDVCAGFIEPARAGAA
jgi:oxygen-independent coproporphyrinogen III oxidase